MYLWELKHTQHIETSDEKVLLNLETDLIHRVMQSLLQTLETAYIVFETAYVIP